MWDGTGWGRDGRRYLLCIDMVTMLSLLRDIVLTLSNMENADGTYIVIVWYTVYTTMIRPPPSPISVVCFAFVQVLKPGVV